MMSGRAEIIEAAARGYCKGSRPVINPDKSSLSLVPVRDGDGFIKRACFYEYREWHNHAEPCCSAVLAALRAMHASDPKKSVEEWIREIEGT